MDSENKFEKEDIRKMNTEMANKLFNNKKVRIELIDGLFIIGVSMVEMTEYVQGFSMVREEHTRFLYGLRIDDKSYNVDEILSIEILEN